MLGMPLTQWGESNRGHMEPCKRQRIIGGIKNTFPPPNVTSGVQTVSRSFQSSIILATNYFHPSVLSSFCSLSPWHSVLHSVISEYLEILVCFPQLLTYTHPSWPSESRSSGDSKSRRQTQTRQKRGETCCFIRGYHSSYETHWFRHP